MPEYQDDHYVGNNDAWEARQLYLRNNAERAIINAARPSRGRHRTFKSRARQWAINAFCFVVVAGVLWLANYLIATH